MGRGKREMARGLSGGGRELEELRHDDVALEHGGIREGVGPGDGEARAIEETGDAICGEGL